MAKSTGPNFRSEVSFLAKLPGPKRLSQFFENPPEAYLLIYDKRLLSRPGVSSWIKEFRFSYPVKGGEKLKDVDALPDHLKKMIKLLGAVSPHNFGVVALGGGTVGDFAGFVASIFKRGVPLVQVPSTLLSAVDSAHGGKTALNVGDLKNQVGTYHPARAVVIVKELFAGLPAVQVQSAIGELVKVALIGGGELFIKVKAETFGDFESFWNLLPVAIEAKYKVVEVDPLETEGQRQTLNLGHSLGHALESYYDLPHGIAVGLGLQFALRWSQHRGYMSAELLQELLDVINGPAQIQSPEEFFKNHRRMSRSKLEKLIAQDKKLKDSTHLNFIFLEGVGSAFRKSVTLDSLLTEAERQGWVA